MAFVSKRWLFQMPVETDVPRGHLTHFCYVDSGKHYEGAAATTGTGKTCMNWSDAPSRYRASSAVVSRM